MNGAPIAPSLRAEAYESFVVRVLVRRATGAIVSGHVIHPGTGQRLNVKDSIADDGQRRQ